MLAFLALVGCLRLAAVQAFPRICGAQQWFQDSESYKSCRTSAQREANLNRFARPARRQASRAAPARPDREVAAGFGVTPKSSTIDSANDFA
ncbi:hypothetical protein NDR89_23025 [Cupriavidus gilardii]|uniref:DUF3551 domain-containing protein n=1 Tax=Cupriavidus gilardii TaxID=82541 RepID=A0ABY4VR31_9BURK|nr:hypothetical protein [Cupriavidus gilardii]USE79466.1 hypothetical protein NDR89_23025 [Cupriavidus gilardii]